MSLHKILRLTLLIGGIGFIVGFSLVPIGFFKASILTTDVQKVELSYQYMLAAIYFIVGSLMILASKQEKYDQWRYFFYFVVFSSYAHAVVMLIDVVRGNPLGMSYLPGSLGLVAVATLLVFTKKAWN